MNIDEYRALIAQQKEQENNPEKVEKPNAQTQQSSDGETTASQEEAKEGGAETQSNPEQTTPPSDEPVEKDKPFTVEIDGQELTLDELKNGYLRQSDYTRKTQEAKRKEQQAEQALQFINQLQQNPQVAQQLAQQFNMPNLDPNQAKVVDLENRYYDLLIETQIKELETKYGSFDVREVLETAQKGNLTDLDMAYHIVQSRKGGGQETKQESALDIDQLKEQLRADLLKELQTQQDSNVDTSTIIQSGGDAKPVTDPTPTLTPQEAKVARMMGMDAKEYATWRDAK